MSGNLVMSDTVDLPALFGDSGTDLLRLVIKTPTINKEQEINRLFHIYRLSDQQKTGERAQTYVYHFVALESLIESGMNLSRTFRGKAEDNIKKILTDDISTSVPFNIDSTTSDITYTSNYWSPIKNFSYNADLAVCSEDNTPSMIFFENRKGFNFKSLAKMSNEEPKLYFTTDNSLSSIATDGMNSGDVFKDLANDYRNISLVRIPALYDYIKDKANGALSTRMFSYDTVTKKFTDTTYTANDDTRARANPNKFYTEKLISGSFKGTNSTVMLNQAHHMKLYDNTTEVSDYKVKQQRIGIINQMQQHRIEITVFGRTDYTVGRTVKVDINALRQFDNKTSKDDIYDPMLSGKYLISAVAHRFDRTGKHECTLELIRDSIGKTK
jgi:hypothetical protein